MDNNTVENDNLAKLRSEFAANVSHELKTPLTSIKGFADMLVSGLVTDEDSKMRFITMISVEADRMINLINDILKLSELEEVKIAHPVSNSDVLLLARETAERLMPAAHEAQVTLHVCGDEAQLPIEQERLRLLFINLIENAIKYNKPRGSVHVTVKHSGDMVSICVADTGIGIPEEHQSRIFERFYRVDKSRSKKTGGTGLGLAIVKHVTALYGGKLNLRSHPGVGTTIVVEFPCNK